MDRLHNLKVIPLLTIGPQFWASRRSRGNVDGLQPSRKKTDSEHESPAGKTRANDNQSVELRRTRLNDIDTTLTIPTINVVLFGEAGVGKSSIINLIARKAVAQISSDVEGCTMQSTRYIVPFDGINFAIFDTIGLEQPQYSVNDYLKAIAKAYELITKLSANGGIHLLLFCMRGGRITATTQSNYRLFRECLCSTQVPIALVFTGLEREEEMENWWMRNETHIEHYGLKSNGHACITAVEDDTPGEDLKFTESQKRIRELLKDCALGNDAFILDTQTWFTGLGRGMKSFIVKHRSPKRKDVIGVLTKRNKLDHGTAKKIAMKMEGDDPETQGPFISTINIILFGETGAGKSSVINLIAQKAVAQVSSHVDSCTMQSTRYFIPFNGINFAFFETVGLVEPQYEGKVYLEAIGKGYELITKLSATGGIHLLLFCIRGGMITAMTRDNYRVFYECLCRKKVPIALVFTGLEGEENMEDWWTRNKSYIEDHGIKSDGHACITAVKGDTPGEDLKFTESQERIRKLIEDCALKDDAFILETQT